MCIWLQGLMSDLLYGFIRSSWLSGVIVFAVINWVNCGWGLVAPSYHTISYHYSDVIMSTIVSQITSLTIVYSTTYSGADQRKHRSYAPMAFVRWIFPAQRGSNTENVSIWWRHHVVLASIRWCTKYIALYSLLHSVLVVIWSNI